MGWEVIALGSIYFVKRADKKKKEQFVKELELDEFVINAELKGNGGFVNVEMSGNKGIDYSNLTDLCDKYAEIIDGESISFGEYSETGDGFYWERKVRDGFDD